MVQKRYNIGSMVFRTGKLGWGYPRIYINGLSLFTWGNDGSFHLASYHPRSSITWLWDITIGWPTKKCRSRVNWWKPGYWKSSVKTAWSIWALGFSVSYSSQERLNYTTGTY